MRFIATGSGGHGEHGDAKAVADPVAGVGSWSLIGTGIGGNGVGDRQSGVSWRWPGRAGTERGPCRPVERRGYQVSTDASWRSWNSA